MLFLARTSHLKRALRTGGGAPPPPPPPPIASVVNVALIANGGVATASSFYSGSLGSFAPSNAINGDRKGLNWGQGGVGNSGGWNDNTTDVWPDWLQVTFPVAQTVDVVDVFSVQDNYLSPIEPTPGLTFTLYGLVDFQIQYWNGSAFVSVTGGSVTGNNLVWRRVSFPPVTTTAIRLNVTAALASYSRAAELEVWTAGTVNPSPPVISITTPRTDQIVRPGPVHVEATINPATQTGGLLSRVQILRNDEVIHTINPATAGTITFDDEDVEIGVHVYKVRAFDDTHALTSEATVTNVDVREAFDSPSSGNWEQRRATGRVVGSWALETVDEVNFDRIDGQDAIGWDMSGVTPGPQIDTVIKPPGALGSLKFTTLQGGSANAGGTMFINFSGGNMHPSFGPVVNPSVRTFRNVGDVLYVQLLFYAETGWVNEPLARPNGSLIGHKFFDLGPGDIQFGQTTPSSTPWKIVVSAPPESNTFLTLYNIGRTSETVPLYESKPNGDLDLQPRGDPNYVSYFDYAINHLPFNAYHPNAKGDVFVGEWLQYKYRIEWLETLFTQDVNAGGAGHRALVRSKLWGGRTGENPELSYDHIHEQWVHPTLGLSKLWIFPNYFTEKDTGQLHGPVISRVARAIVSLDDIPDALEVSVNRNPNWLATLKSNPANQNVFVDIPGTTPSSYLGTDGYTDLRATWAPSGVPGTWERRTIEDYCGMGYDRLRGRIYLAAHGGHNSVGQNGVYGCDLTTNVDKRRWYVARESTVVTGNDTDPNENYRSHFPDGRPVSRHTEYCQWVVETPQGPKIVLPYNPAATVRGTGGPNGEPPPPGAADAYVINAGDWEPAGTWQLPPANLTHDECVCTDFDTGDIYYYAYSTHTIYKTNNTTKTWQIVKAGTDGWGVRLVGMCFDKARRRLVIAGSDAAGGATGFFGVYNLDAGAFQTVQVTGDLNGMKTRTNDSPRTSLTHCYIPGGIDYYLFMGDTGHLKKITPSFVASTVLTNAPIPTMAQTGAGLYNRLEFDPDFGGCVLGSVGWHEPVRFLWTT